MSQMARAISLRTKTTGAAVEDRLSLFVANDEHREANLANLDAVGDDLLVLAMSNKDAAPDIARTIGNAGRSTAGDAVLAILKSLSIPTKDDNGVASTRVPSDWISVPACPAWDLLGELESLAAPDRDSATNLCDGEETAVAELQFLVKSGYFKKAKEVKKALVDAYVTKTSKTIPREKVSTITLGDLPACVRVRPVTLAEAKKALEQVLETV